MEAFLLVLVLIAYPVTLICNYNFGYQDASLKTREQIVIFCNQKPEECKKEFENYQLKETVENFKLEELG
ncbi:hypothetical protein MUO98_08365 [Candidatus Bathyarchaeota archaeon]|nr:hypothetical protein [Candidatus Bathyarchaeota archaeon]